MDFTHSKGLMYPALKLSSFRVRRDSLPPAFELPDEIKRVASEPLPELRDTAFEKKALEENLKLLEEDEKEREATCVAIAEGKAALESVIVEEPKEEEVPEPVSNEDVVRRLCDMGFLEPDVRKALISNDWDENRAVNALLSGVN